VDSGADAPPQQRQQPTLELTSNLLRCPEIIRISITRKPMASKRSVLPGDDRRNLDAEPGHNPRALIGRRPPQRESAAANQKDRLMPVCPSLLSQFATRSCS